MLDKQDRIFLYGFLSRVYADTLDEKCLSQIKQNQPLLKMLGETTVQWFNKHENSYLKEKLNIDFTSLFLMDAKPLQTPTSNYAAQALQNPDHISNKLAHMHDLISKDELQEQQTFLKKQLLNWAVSYFIGIRPMCSTPFYGDLCDFTVKFLASDYEFLSQATK